MVLVAAALLGLLALGFSEMIGGAMKGQKNVQNAVDFDILKTSINMVLNTKACDGAFKDSAGNNVTMNFGTTPLTLSPPTNLIAPGTSVGINEIYQGNSLIAKNGANLGGRMKISKLEFTDAIYDGDQILGTPAVTYKAFVATLNVEATKASGSYGNQSPKKTFSVRLLLRPDASNTAGAVEKCGAAGDGFRVEGSSTPSPANTCSANFGGFCGNPYTRQVVFAQPFKDPPLVQVSLAQANSQGACGSSSDRDLAYAENVTATGFRMVCSSSPMGSAGGQCATYDGYWLSSSCNWIAVGP